MPAPNTLRLDVTETGYGGLFTATSSDSTVATVSPASAVGPDATFTVTPLRSGVVNISISDAGGGLTSVRYNVQVGPTVSYTVIASDLFAGRILPTTFIVATLAVANAASAVVEDPYVCLASLVGAAPAQAITISPLHAGSTFVDVTDSSGAVQQIPVLISYVAPPIAIPNLNIPSCYKPPNWLLLIYDADGMLVDVPQSDIESINLKRVLNGGPSDATITFKRPFNQIGRLGFSYQFAFYFWSGGDPRPADPWWVGYQVDPEQVQRLTSGRVVVTCFGDAKRLDDARISADVNPNVNGNPNLDAADFLRAAITELQPPGWLAPSIPASMFNMMRAQWQHQALGQFIDDVCKMGREGRGPLFSWRVVTNAALQRQVVVEVDQNPNVISGAYFVHKFLNSQISDYDIKTKYRDIVNLVTVYGDTDPTIGQQVYGVFEDATSVADVTAGRVIENAIQVQGLQSADDARAYAENWLKLNAYPQAQGSARVLVVDPNLQEGSWVQFWESPGYGGDETIIKQVRASEVDLLISKVNTIEQRVHTDSPIPYLDEAIYRLGLNVKTQGAIANKARPVNKQTLFIRSGGVVTATASSPAKVALSECEAVFPGAGVVYAAALGLTTLTDNSGGPHNGETGDGQYWISLASTNAWIITKGDEPPQTAILQNVLSVWVNQGIPFCNDIRTLAGQPAFSGPLAAPTFKAGTVQTLGTPVNSGLSGAYDQPVDFWLDPATWTSNNERLAYFEIGIAPHGQAAPESGYQKVNPTIDAHYDITVNALGSGTAYDLYVRAHDNLDRATAWLAFPSPTDPNIIKGGAFAPIGSFGQFTSDFKFHFTASGATVVYWFDSGTDGSSIHFVQQGGKPTALTGGPYSVGASTFSAPLDTIKAGETLQVGAGSNAEFLDVLSVNVGAGTFTTSAGAVNAHSAGDPVYPISVTAPNSGTSSSPITAASSLASGDVVYFMIYWVLATASWTVDIRVNQPFSAAEYSAAYNDGILPALATVSASPVSQGSGGGTRTGGGGGRNQEL